MDKISVSVRIPALCNTYDFIVPANMATRDIQMLIVRMLSEEYGVSGNFAEAILLDTADTMVLRPECNFSQLGIADGAKLMLM